MVLSSDDEGATSTKSPRKKQVQKKSPGRPPRAAKTTTTPLPTGLFGKEYEFRPRENKLLALSSEDEPSPAVTRKAKGTTANTRMSLSESKFRRRIADVNKGVSTAKKATSTPQPKSTSRSPQVKTKLKFDSSQQRRSGRKGGPMLTIEQVTDDNKGEEKNPKENLSVVAEADEEPAKEEPQTPVPDENYPGWPAVGWKEFALAAFVTGLAAVGYVCYTTDYCSFC